MAFGWKLHGDGKTPPPGEVVAPGRAAVLAQTVGIGAQHVVAMFGATFVFPLVMGLNPQPRDHDVRDRDDPVPADRERARCRATWAPAPSFVGGVAAIRAQGGDSRDVTGAILVAGVVLAARRRADPLRSAPRSSTRCCRRSSPARSSC